MMQQSPDLRLAPPAGARLAIVGGCGGIGRAVVTAALASGLEVAVLDLPQSIAAVPPPAGVLVYETDATQSGQVNAAFADLATKWGGLECLVNLAGFLREFGAVANYTETAWRETMDGSLHSTYLACQAALPLMKKSGKPGAIVNMSTGIAYLGRPNYGPYAAAKAAIGSLTRTLAAENAPLIRVNCVAPGAVNTAFLSGGTGHGGQAGAAPTRVNLAEFAKLVPLGYIAEPAEIAEPIMFLLGPASRYITGQVLHINGGSLMM